MARFAWMIVVKKVEKTFDSTSYDNSQFLATSFHFPVSLAYTWMRINLIVNEQLIFIWIDRDKANWQE